MNLLQMLAGMQGGQGQMQQQMPQQQFQGLDGNPMAMAMFGNMPYLNLPQRGPGPMPQGRPMTQMGGGMPQPPAPAAPQAPAWDLKTHGPRYK